MTTLLSKPEIVADFRKIPNTNTYEDGKVVKYGIHHVTQKAFTGIQCEQPEYLLTHVGNNDTLKVQITGVYSHIKLSYKQEAYGDRYYFSTPYGTRNNTELVANALEQILHYWLQTSNGIVTFVETIPQAEICIYNVFWGIGD